MTAILESNQRSYIWQFTNNLDGIVNQTGRLVSDLFNPIERVVAAFEVGLNRDNRKRYIIGSVSETCTF